MNLPKNTDLIDISFVKKNFIFCDIGIKKFENEFFIEFKNINECPKCFEKYDIHSYKDLFICFKCKYKIHFTDEYILALHNGYLCRIHKISGKIGYFHRFLMLEKIIKLANQLNIDKSKVHVHHKNEFIRDNTLVNLEVMTEEEHHSHHQQVGTERAFDTWCLKKFGECYEPDDQDYEEFLEWRETHDTL